MKKGKKGGASPAKKVTLNNAKDSVQMILTVLLGLALGTFTLNQIPSQYGKYFTAAIGVGGPFFFTNKTAKLLATTIGAAGVAKIFKDLSAGKTGGWSVLNSYTPTLSGGMRGFKGLGNFDLPANQLGNIEDARLLDPASSLGSTPLAAMI